MGPFKYPVDDALDNRKAAYECMYTILQSCIDKLNIFQFLDHVELGFILFISFVIQCFIFYIVILL